jgi:prepilin-type N-terminal cleavage/methylation domain-containing protein
MKVIRNPRQPRMGHYGFTLIEMIGVLAVIAILASMLIPKIFEAINSARINNTVTSYNAIKTAVMDHYGKYGSINFVGVPAPGAAATAAQMTNYDRAILLPEQLIDKPFVARVGTAWQVQAVAGAGAVAVTGANSGYDLDGSGAAANDADPAAFVVEAIITGVAAADAIEISQRLDGAGTVAQPLSFPAGGADLAGRVKYADPAATGGITTVHIYICHR